MDVTNSVMSTTFHLPIPQLLHYHILHPSSPDALEADLFRVGMSTLRLAGEACARGPMVEGLYKSIRNTMI